MTLTAPEPDDRRSPDASVLPKPVTGGLVAVVFVLNAVILGYAMYISRPGGVLPGPAAQSLVAVAARADGGPIIPGLHEHHPLSTHQVGDVLIGELNCVACHEDPDAAPLARDAPDLGAAGWRIDPAFLRRFIADPAAADPGTAMPDLLGARSATERASIAADITAFLVDRAEAPFERAGVPPEEVAEGHALFHSVGCVACHAPRDSDGREVDADGAVPLAHVVAKYGYDSLAAFLFQPLSVRPSGRMPDMTLAREEAAAIAAYLLTAAPGPSIDDEPAAGDAARGRRHFIELDCAACHALDGMPAPRRARPLADLDPASGCLSSAPIGSPDFGLDEQQTRAIRAALSAPAGPPGGAAAIDMALTSFNCIACHARDDYGGVAVARDRFFTTSEPSLGDEARIPPRLTLVGAKLRTEWLQRVMFDAAAVRPYMHVRMPQFGEANLGDLPELVARVDRVEAVEYPELDDDGKRAYRDAGRLLVGDKGLNCISCHAFAGKKGPGFGAIDLLTSAERLEGDWFRHFLRAPSVHRPGIPMPDFWAGGIASRTDVLDGDVDAQIHAIRHYLSLGQSARLPDGVRAVPSKLAVTTTARTYRGRSRIAGFRGIAVGFPDRINYAFNARTGALTGIWRGDYVTVNWSGQGAGDFTPAGRPIRLAQDVAFLGTLAAGAPWPLHPVTTEENPVDPDPLYPRNHGYAFQGYFFDDASVPTFMYRCDDVGIEDRSAPAPADGATVLVRTLTFEAPAARTLWFRALTGAIAASATNDFEIPGLRVRVPDLRTSLRAAAEEGRQELLVEIPLPQGRSTVTIHYELLD